MKKTNRKNNTKLTVNWPDNIFTIKDLTLANPEFVVITLRDKTKKAILRGEVMEIGVLHNGLGRPTNVMTFGPVTDTHLQEAKDRAVVLKSQYAPAETPTSVNVVTINNGTAETNESTRTEVTVTEKANA